MSALAPKRGGSKTLEFQPNLSQSKVKSSLPRTACHFRYTKRKGPTEPSTDIIPYRGETVLGPVGPVTVTGVCPTERPLRPVATCLAGGPGTPHPVRFSGLIPPEQTLPRCSPVAC